MYWNVSFLSVSCIDFFSNTIFWDYAITTFSTFLFCPPNSPIYNRKTSFSSHWVTETNLFCFYPRGMRRSNVVWGRLEPSGMTERKVQAPGRTVQVSGTKALPFSCWNPPRPLQSDWTTCRSQREGRSGLVGVSGRGLEAGHKGSHSREIRVAWALTSSQLACNSCWLLSTSGWHPWN